MSWGNAFTVRRITSASFIQPCLATEAATPPTTAGWVHEIKHDGYRMQLQIRAVRREKTLRLFTRRGFDWTKRYPRVTKAAEQLNVLSCIIDGELVCENERGIAAKLHSGVYDRDAFFYAFDLIELDGADLRPLPLRERKKTLLRLLGASPSGIRFVEHDGGDGSKLFASACRMGLEGIVSKKLDSRYRPGPKRCLSWVKVKNPKSPSVRRIQDGMEG